MLNGVDRYAGGALLAAGGELPSPDLVTRLAGEHGSIVATDGAGARILAMGIRPGTIIGDMDSIGQGGERLAMMGTAMISRPSQEQNDLEKALLWLMEQGVMQATIIGAGGGMIDHALNNFSVLARFARRMRIAIRDDASHGYLVPDELRLATCDGERLSLIPLPAVRLTTEGLAWELNEADLAFGVREGASNRSTGNEARIRVHEGMVLVVHYPANQR